MFTRLFNYLDEKRSISFSCQPPQRAFKVHKTHLIKELEKSVILKYQIDGASNGCQDNLGHHAGQCPFQAHCYFRSPWDNRKTCRQIPVYQTKTYHITISYVVKKQLQTILK
ncbi:hypothetical protein KC19_VG006900 [Ceratodon purpureus]|uniref:Uncharacterized protein n=1 Tax=Ceratodon purpureus TaxID=3225 RepID=A0A8T0HKP7_CERPU|nr:hypothetical protein KC19_VG006900 [Ceratodon purpureus]